MVWTTKPPIGTQLDLSHPLNQGLNGLWLFNEGDGNIVSELSGFGTNGVLTNMAFPSTTTSGWNPGRAGPSIAFDRLDDYIDCGNDVVFDYTTQDFTISMWVYPIQTLSIVPLSRGLFNTDGWYIQFYNTGVVALRTSIAGITAELNATGYDINTWQHFVFQRIGNSGKIYKNGVQLSTKGSCTSPVTSTRNLYIGKYSGGGNVFYGLIDEVRIWNRVLTSTEVNELYINPYGMFLDTVICPEITCTLSVQ